MKTLVYDFFSTQKRQELQMPLPPTVGITDMQRNLRTYLARVKAGESFIITKRGVPILSLQSTSEYASWQSRLHTAQVLTQIHYSVRTKVKPAKKATSN